MSKTRAHREAEAQRKAIRDERTAIKERLSAKHERCEACKWICPRLFRLPESLLHMHHVIPVQCGGTNELSNLVMICPNCHAMTHRIFGVRKGKYFGPVTREELIHQLRRYLSDLSGVRIMKEVVDSATAGMAPTKYRRPQQQRLFEPELGVIDKIPVGPETRGRRPGQHFRDYRTKR